MQGCGQKDTAYIANQSDLVWTEIYIPWTAG